MKVYKIQIENFRLLYLLGHECIQTIMVFLDITTEQESKALEIL